MVGVTPDKPLLWRSLPQRGGNRDESKSRCEGSHLARRGAEAMADSEHLRWVHFASQQPGGGVGAELAPERGEVVEDLERVDVGCARKRCPRSVSQTPRLDEQGYMSTATCVLVAAGTTFVQAPVCVRVGNQVCTAAAPLIGLSTPNAPGIVSLL